MLPVFSSEAPFFQINARPFFGTRDCYVAAVNHLRAAFGINSVRRPTRSAVGIMYRSVFRIGMRLTIYVDFSAVENVRPGAAVYADCRSVAQIVYIDFSRIFNMAPLPAA